MKKRLILFVVVLLVFTGISLFVFTYYSRAGRTITLTELLGQSGPQLSNEADPETTTIGSPTFLSNPDSFLDATLEINLETLFSAPVVFQEDITAPNILYSLDVGEGLKLEGDAQSPTISNAGVLSVQDITGGVEFTGDNITISTSGNTINFSANLPDVDYPDGDIVGTTDTQLLSNKTVSDLIFDVISAPSAVAGKVYFDSSSQSLNVYTDTYGWVDLSSTGTPYTTDGEGIEVVGNQFSLELDGTTLTKTASGLKVAPEVSLLGQSIDGTEIESQTILPDNINTGGTTPVNGDILVYNSTSSLFEWQDATSFFGTPWSRDTLTGTLTPATSNDVVNISSSNTPLSLTNSGTGYTLQVNDSVGDTTPFVIDADGNVGIGTSTPLYALDVAGVIGVNGGRALYVPNQTSFAGTIVVGDGGTSLVNGGGTQGQSNTFLGIGSGKNTTTADANTFVGADAGFSNVTGAENTFIGQRAGYSNTIGIANTLVGRFAGASSADGNNNAFFGEFAGLQNTSGSANTVLGTGANTNNQTGSNNVIIGYQAGYGGTGVHNKAGNVFIGYRAGYNEISSNKLYIENSNSTTPLIWGDFQSDIVGINGKLGVGTITPNAKLDTLATTTQLRLSYNLSSYVNLYSNSSGELGISPSGINVGIGTTNPSYPLDVVGTARLTGNLRLQGALYDAAGNPGIAGNFLVSTGVGTTWQSAATLLNTTYFKNLGNSFGAAAQIGTTDANSLSLITAGNQNVSIDTLGNVGIGGTAPSTEPSLFVSSAGQVGIGNTAPGSQLTIEALGSSAGTTLVIDSSGNVWKDSSSRKYKTNIQPLQVDFKKILDLNPVSYDFISNGIHTIGYIAEEVDAAGLTDLVVYNKVGEPDAIKYDRFAIYLAEIVKEQQKSISHLQKLTMQLDTEGAVEMPLPSTDNLPVAEPEMDSAPTESSADFTALKTQIDEVITPKIAEIQQTLGSISSRSDEGLATTSARIIEQDDLIASLSARLDVLTQDVLGVQSDLLTASVSAALTPESVVVEDITSTGKANFYDVGVTGELIAGLVSIDGVSGTINTLGEPLQLQSDRLADVEFMGGLVKVSTEGHLDVTGDVTAHKYQVDTADLGTASAGEATVPAGSSEVLVQTESVTEGSLIYVTFTSDYSPATRYWIEKRVNGESFILKTDDPVDSESKFSWWIVN